MTPLCQLSVGVNRPSSEATGHDDCSCRSGADKCAPAAQRPRHAGAKKRGRLVAVVAFVCLAALQQTQQIVWATVVLQVIDLLLIVSIDEGFDRGYGGIHGALASQRRQCTGQPACQPPRPKQTTATLKWQPGLDEAQMVGLDVAVSLREPEQFGVAAPCCNAGNAAVDVNGPRLAGMV